MRRHRSGNRQLNAALHRIALIQIRDNTPGADYYKTRMEAGGYTRDGQALPQAASGSGGVSAAAG